MPKETYLKVYLLTSTLVGVAIAIFVILGISPRKYIEAKLPVNFSFSQEANNTPGQFNFKLMLEPRSYRVSFVKVRIYFNPDVVQLAQDADALNSPFSVVSITPFAQANESGSVEISLAQVPDMESPQNIFEIAHLYFKQISDNPSEITVVDEDTQVVGNDSETIPFTADYAMISPTN